MDKKEYRNLMRISRGKLSKMNNELDDIYDCGSDALLEWSINTKIIGVTKMSEIATGVSIDEQDKLVIWLQGERRTSTDIDMKLLEIM